MQIKEHQHSSAADTADSLPSSAGDQLRRNTLLSGEAFPWSHRAFSFNIHLAASFGLLAQLLLCEGDVGIHQASSNTAKKKRLGYGHEARHMVEVHQTP